MLSPHDPASNVGRHLWGLSAQASVPATVSGVAPGALQGTSHAEPGLYFYFVRMKDPSAQILNELGSEFLIV